MTKPEPEVLIVDGPAALERWLEEHGASTDEGVWLRLRKKTAPADAPPGPTYEEAVLVGLCFGWIDGQGRKYDDVSSLVRFTPRRARSVWSKVNVERAERLIAEGRMRPEGLAQVERARADGRWERAYDPPSTSAVPADFLAALEERPAAKTFFATLDKRNTFPIAYRLQTAAKPETRAKRMEAILAKLERGERFYG